MQAMIQQTDSSVEFAEQFCQKCDRATMHVIHRIVVIEGRDKKGSDETVLCSVCQRSAFESFAHRHGRHDLIV